MAARRGIKLRKTVEAAPALPDGFEYLWEWFAALHRRRTGSGFGSNPLTSEAIDTWSRLMQVGMTPWEFETICALDDTYMADQSRKIAERVAKNERQTKPKSRQKPETGPLARGRR